MAKNDFEAVSLVVRRVYAGIGTENFNSRVPAFTKTLAPGLGLAEHPVPDLTGFAWSLPIVVGGLIQAHTIGKQSLANASSWWEGCLAEDGLSLERPLSELRIYGRL